MKMKMKKKKKNTDPCVKKHTHLPIKYICKPQSKQASNASID